MAVFRIEKTKDYTIMSNRHLRDKTLSLKAKGLLSQMLSLPEDWDYTLAGLSHINRESTDAVRTAVLELEVAGYITRQQKRDEKGKMSNIEYTIYEQPQKANMPYTSLDSPILENPISENPITDNPILENPITDNPISDYSVSENPTQLNKDPINKDILNKDILNKDPINPILSSFPASAESAEDGIDTAYVGAVGHPEPFPLDTRVAQAGP
jgi:hypothetical protein